jgi:hypothetical protein
LKAKSIDIKIRTVILYARYKNFQQVRGVLRDTYDEKKVPTRHEIKSLYKQFCHFGSVKEETEYTKQTNNNSSSDSSIDSENEIEKFHPVKKKKRIKMKKSEKKQAEKSLYEPTQNEQDAVLNNKNSITPKIGSVNETYSIDLEKKCNLWLFLFFLIVNYSLYA